MCAGHEQNDPEPAEALRFLPLYSLAVFFLKIHSSLSSASLVSICCMFSLTGDSAEVRYTSASEDATGPEQSMLVFHCLV